MVKVKDKEKSSKKEKKAKSSEKGKAFMAPKQPDKVLAAVLGSDDPLPRPHVVKALWAKIKDTKGMQEGRTIHAKGDEAWLEFFGGKKSITMFDMPKLIGKHLS